LVPSSEAMSSSAPQSDAVVAYANATLDVVDAGQWLRRQVEDGDGAAIERAIQRLEGTIAIQDGHERGLERSHFSGVATDAAPAAGAEELPDDILATALTEVQTAEAMFDLAQALGETRPGSRPQAGTAKAQASLLVLERTAQALPQADSGAPERFRERHAPAFTDVGAGLAAFEAQAGAALTGFVAEAETTVTDVLEKLKKLDPANVLDAIKSLGGALVPQLARAGRVVALGVSKLERAISALTRLFPGDRVAKLRVLLEEFWNAVKGPQPLRDSLRWAFGVEETETAVRGLLEAPGVTVSRVNEAVAELAGLPERFAKGMKLVDRLAKGVFAIVVTLTALGALSGTLAVLAPNAAAVALAAYVLLMAVVIGLGMDYTDSGRGLGRVAGVRSIASGLEGT
jgi:hypothetical protein